VDGNPEGPWARSLFIHPSIRSRCKTVWAFNWETGVGRGSRHGRKHVGDFGHQQQGQRIQAFAAEATCRGSNAVARSWLPSNYATLHLVRGVDFLCFRLFHGTLAQSQRKLPGPVRARVASSCQLLLLGSFSAMLWDFVLFLQYRTKKLQSLKSWDPTLIVISRQYVAHPSLPPSLLLEFSHIPTVFPRGHQVSIGLGNWTLKLYRDQEWGWAANSVRSCTWALEDFWKMIFWLVLKLEISHNRVIIISWRIFFGFF